jgi:hypothetical protein
MDDDRHAFGESRNDFRLDVVAVSQLQLAYTGAAVLNSEHGPNLAMPK